MTTASSELTSLGKDKPVVLTIAALDPSGGAGIIVDLRTFAAEDVWGCGVVTAITFQSTSEIIGWDPLPADTISTQLDILFRDIEIDAVKIGMIGAISSCHVIAQSLRRLRQVSRGHPGIVLDPVLWSSRGESLGEPGVMKEIIEFLFPMVDLVTPNLDEVAAITGIRPVNRDEIVEAAREIGKLGPASVLITGGHAETEVVADVLWCNNAIEVFEAPWLDSANTHGTGCVLSAGIAAALARGAPIREAVMAGRSRVRTAILAGFDLGAGTGPVDPLGDGTN